MVSRRAMASSAMALPLHNVGLTDILSWCSREKEIICGRCIHDHILRNSMDSASAMDAYLQTSLLHMYARCGLLNEARHVFHSYAVHGNVVTWNAMLGAFEQQQNLGREVFSFFRRMHIHGIAPDRVTIDLVLSACARNAMDKEEDDDDDDDDATDDNEGFFDPIELGKRIHACFMQPEPFMDLGIVNSLINMYAKCGSLEDARTMFLHTCEKKNVVTWNAMASAFAVEAQRRDGCLWKGCALQLVEQMQCEGVLPDNVTFINILGSYTQASALAEGKRMHVYLRSSGFAADVIVGTSLLSMYGRCLDVMSAKRALERMECRNTISWNAAIGAYIHNGLAKDAIAAFAHMQASGLHPNESTFMGILSACIMMEAASLTLGRHIHFWAVSSGCDDRIALGSALMQMYAKCGCIEDAYTTSSNRAAAAVSKDLISWNTLISCYAQHGYGREALCVYDRMRCEGTLPNKATLVSALYACSHCGLINEATKLLVSVNFDRHRLRRRGAIGLVLEHLHCMLDLLGRVGLLSEAQKLLYGMPFQPSPLSMMILLGACKTQHDVGRGEEFASHMLELDPEAPPAYVMLSNIYYDEKCLELAF